jgi:hypothetical protein
MRSAVAFLLVAACADQPPAAPLPPAPIDTVWADTIHPGATIVLVPGTGSYDYLSVPIEALPGNDPVVDPRAIAKVGDDAVVFEQAIAAAHRAGVDVSDLSFGLWGAGFTRLSKFTYVSYEGLHVPIDIIGGANSCATGLIVENLINYNAHDAAADAADLRTRAAAWAAGRDVIVSAHSWGGAVAEYLAENDNLATFTVAAGVPGGILDYMFTGPGLRQFGGGYLFEIDRPDDPVHAMNPSGNPSGHQYVILYGDTFEGAYGVTTEELACKGVPGECPLP